VKTLKELQKEIEKVLGDKVSVAVKAFQAQREEDFKELMSLNERLEDLEKKKAPFLEEKKGLNTLIDKDLGRFNYLENHLRWLDGQIKGYKDQIEKLTQKLTEVEIDPKTLSLFLNFKS
jgi:DNA repair exonuclease SbcCD ATPase subunit